MSTQDPVVVAAFRSPQEASQARSFLQRENIAANMAPRQESLERLCADVFDDGFDVIVARDDAADAIALLQRVWPDDAIDAEVVARCPACDSTDVWHIPRARIFVIAAIVLVGASLVFGQRDLFLLVIAIIGAALVLTPARRCRACGEHW